MMIGDIREWGAHPKVNFYVSGSKIAVILNVIAQS